MTARYQKMTGRQFRGVVAPYLAAFPKWGRIDDVGIFRDEFPIRQEITFENLDSGMYRPVHVIRALPLPISRMLFQHLSAGCRQLTIHQHESRWKEMLSCMQRQFRPSVMFPLKLDQVIDLCEQEARNQANDSIMLAILYAWQGDVSRAIDYCLRAQGAGAPTIAPRSDWEQSLRSFSDELKAAIESGQERTFLLSKVK